MCQSILKGACCFVFGGPFSFYLVQLIWFYLMSGCGKKILLKSQTSLIQLKLTSAVDQFFFLQQKGKLPFVVCHPPLFLWMIFWTKNIVGGKCSCCCADSEYAPLWKSPISRSYLPIYELCWKTPKYKEKTMIARIEKLRKKTRKFSNIIVKR